MSSSSPFPPSASAFHTLHLPASSRACLCPCVRLFLGAVQVRYLVEPPPPDADPKRSFKYPFTACEIFCCEVEGIFNTLLEHEDVLGRLFSILEVGGGHTAQLGAASVWMCVREEGRWGCRVEVSHPWVHAGGSGSIFTLLRGIMNRWERVWQEGGAVKDALPLPAPNPSKAGLLLLRTAT